MIVELNGSPSELPEKATVADAVAKLGVDGESRGIAVAVDGEIVRRAEWDRAGLREGQTVEVVQAVQGG
ncbi:MAG TPA: sulfur carrier protein ThiS [Candidatus Acidoferrum sp.]|nr:sulfur carrier protein ThiS [Candidatus Acidoferrum sp.]